MRQQNCNLWGLYTRMASFLCLVWLTVGLCETDFYEPAVAWHTGPMWSCIIAENLRFLKKGLSKSWLSVLIQQGLFLSTPSRSAVVLFVYCPPSFPSATQGGHTEKVNVRSQQHIHFTLCMHVSLCMCVWVNGGPCKVHGRKWDASFTPSRCRCLHW